MDRRVVITGMGWVTPLGWGLEPVWKRMLAGESGIGPTTLFDASTFPTTISAEVTGFSLEHFLGAAADEHRPLSRSSSFALAAARDAWAHAGFDVAPPGDLTRTGIYLGAGEGPMSFDPFVAVTTACWDRSIGDEGDVDYARWAPMAFKRFNPFDEQQEYPDQTTVHVSRLLGLEGPTGNTLTACAASAHAIGEASERIRCGDADVMITGGSHSMIHPLAFTGFNRLVALSTQNNAGAAASRPFDRTRDGFVLGEGAGMIVLESAEHAKARGAKIHAELAGYGATCDAYRITDIHPEGRGAIASMRAALESAGVEPTDIDYVSAHGTGTESNDRIETLAIRTVFGNHAPDMAISSIKSMIGHLIAAAGVIELISCVLSIRDSLVPPTINYTETDPFCDLDYTPNVAKEKTIRAALSNSFGFGGQNVTLIVRPV